MEGKDAYKTSYFRNLEGLSELFNTVNYATILHEYVTGEFYFPAIILFRDFSDKLYRTYRTNDIARIDPDFIELHHLLSEAGHETLYSLLTRVISELQDAREKYNYEIINLVTSNYNKTLSLVEEAEAYIEQYLKQRDAIVSKSFPEEWERFHEVVRLSDQIRNNKHQLDKHQKTQRRRKDFSIKSGNLQNLIIGIISFIVIWSISHFFLIPLKGKSPDESGSIPHVEEPYDTKGIPPEEYEFPKMDTLQSTEQQNLVSDTALDMSEPLSGSKSKLTN